MIELRDSNGKPIIVNPLLIEAFEPQQQMAYSRIFMSSGTQFVVHIPYIELKSQLLNLSLPRPTTK